MKTFLFTVYATFRTRNSDLNDCSIALFCGRGPFSSMFTVQWIGFLHSVVHSVSLEEDVRTLNRTAKAWRNTALRTVFHISTDQ